MLAVLSRLLGSGTVPAGVQPWGRDVFDEAPDFAAGTPDWRRVEDEELIFYAPWLAADSRGRAARLGERLEAALAFRAWLVVGALTEVTGDAGAALMRDLSDSGAVGACDVEALVRTGEALARHRSSARPRRPAAVGTQAGAADLVALRSYAFGSLALLWDALNGVSHAGEARPDFTASEPELLLLSLMSGVNAAYLSGQAEPTGETHALACWIGVAALGAACLPEQLRLPLATLIEDAPPGASVAGDLLLHHLDEAVGIQRVRRLLRSGSRRVTVLPREATPGLALWREAGLAARQPARAATAPARIVAGRG